MQREYSCYDDLVLVAGLKKKDTVLFIGTNLTLPWLKKFVSTVIYVKKTEELNKLIAERRSYDRVFMARENVLTDTLVTKAAQLTRTGGLICFFSDDEGLRKGFAEVVTNEYPGADVWSANSNVGPLVMTDANGIPPMGTE